MKVITALIITLLASLSAKETPPKLLPALATSFTERSAKFPKADADAFKEDERTKPLLHLRYLLEMESILREFLNDEADLKAQLEQEDFSNSEKERIIKIRREANAHRASILVNSADKKPRSNPIEKLHLTYERKAKKSLSLLSKNRKLLNRELDRDRLDERRIAKLEEEIKTAEATLAKIQTAFFGKAPRKGFEAPLPQDESGPTADLLSKVISARDQLLTTLRLDPTKAKLKKNDIKKGDVGGIHVRSSNLGVILDKSSSMKPHLEKLRKEIDGGFPDSHYREVHGCALTWQAKPKELGKREHVMLAIEDLIIVQKTDALYWFSDLRDDQSSSALSRLSQLLQRSGAHFYVSSVDRRPKGKLEELITEFNKQ